MQTQEKSFLLLLYNNFAEKNAKPFVTVLIKREILTRRKVFHAQSVVVLQKDAFQNTDFSRLKCQLKRKKNWDSLFVKIFQVSAHEGMRK